VPLNRKITRFGAANPEGPDRYTVTSVKLNTATPEFAPVTEYFAAAQFDNLTDTEKLSRPSFEQMDAGMRVGGDALTAGPSVGTPLHYETVILDAPWQRRTGPRYTVLQDLQVLMLEHGASGRAPLKVTGFSRFSTPTAVPKLSLGDDLFVIATTADATAVPGLTRATSKGAALAALSDHLAMHPEDRDWLQVMPQHEVLSSP